MNTTQKEKGKQALRIFLSYAVAEREYGHKLRRLLSQRPNLQIFTPESLSAGENWESKLKDEISQCDIFVVLLSQNSVNSEWVLCELGAAWALNKLIILVITHPDVVSKIPLDLRRVQSVEIKYLESHPEVIKQILERYEEVATSHNSG
jgi:hypothetical protein